ncbi:hypothetical protein OTU49_010693 [Cherax quadricarinatus]|uniref:Chitin-binding type-2 domain-containing protein n=1 Tax=Cherax quadricarinatus TaxID=27406 RepID=A0AAW0WEF6_CHEQU
MVLSWSVERGSLLVVVVHLLHLSTIYAHPTNTVSSTSTHLLDFEIVPVTNFSCAGKVIGGYYADVYTSCQMFHVCTLNEKGDIHDYTFRCLVGTVFDQETRVCERSDEVDCSKSESFFYLNNDLYGPGIIPSTAHIRVIDGDEATPRTDITSTADFITTSSPTPFVFPETSFSCKDKIIGGLYADVETGCVVFHICSVEPDASTKDNKFVCGVGTLFDQKSRTCQTAALVDCAKAPSFYYLNEPVRHIDGNIDLCRSRPLGTPLADLTTGCQDFTVCEALSDNRLVEKRLSCKKGYLFSQLRQRCALAKKVNCAKETLGEILGMRSSQNITGRKRRAAALFQSRRFRRAALPPLANLVITPGVEDARARRALFNLAALQQWTLENAQHSTFIEVYALQTDGKDHYPKKVYVDTMVPLSSSEAVQRYGYVYRKKRDVSNITVAEQVLTSNTTKVQEMITQTPVVTSGNSDEAEDKVQPVDIFVNKSSQGFFSVPTITTTTIGSTPTALPTVTVSRRKDTSDSFVSPTQPAIPTTLSTVTISPEHTIFKTTSTATVTIIPITVTVTTTKTIVPESLINMHTELSPTGTALETAITQMPVSVTTPLPPPSTTAAIVDSVSKVISTSPPEVKPTAFPNNSQNNTFEMQPAAAGPVSNSDSLPLQNPTENQTLPSITNGTVVQNFTESTIAPSTSPEVSVSSSTSSTPVAVNETESTNVTESSGSVAFSSTTEGVQPNEVVTTTAATTIATALDTSTKISQTVNVTVSANETVATTTESIIDSVNATSTVKPSKDVDVSVNSSTTSVTPSSVTPQGPFTRENLPETNFTCKDKKLEQFYPDPEANCQVFHYCSPGFVKKQVLDLKFLCTGATMFDVNTQKCEDMASVTCGDDKPTTLGIKTTKPTENTTEAPTLSPAAAHNESVILEVPVNITTETSVVNVSHITSFESVTPENITTSNIISEVSTTESTLVAPEGNATTKHENWNSTESLHHISVTKITGEESNITQFSEATEQSVPETTTVTEDPLLMRPEETVIEAGESTSTTVEPSYELITETYTPETEAVTPQNIREDISTSILNLEDGSLTITEFSLQDNPEISTDLSSMFQNDIVFETTTAAEELADISTTELNVNKAATATHTNSSVSIPETSTSISVSTDISAFSNHSASSEASMSSNVSMSSDVSLSVNHNTTEAAAL